MENKDFNEMMIEVQKLWDSQIDMAKQADDLLQKCEEVEGKMIDILKDAQQKYPEEYGQFLNSHDKEARPLELSGFLRGSNAKR